MAYPINYSVRGDIEMTVYLDCDGKLVSIRLEYKQRKNFRFVTLFQRGIAGKF